MSLSLSSSSGFAVRLLRCFLHWSSSASMKMGMLAMKAPTTRVAYGVNRVSDHRWSPRHTRPMRFPADRKSSWFFPYKNRVMMRPMLSMTAWTHAHSFLALPSANSRRCAPSHVQRSHVSTDCAARSAHDDRSFARTSPERQSCDIDQRC